MKRIKPMLALAAGLAIALLQTGCVSGKGWQGLIPDKDVDIEDPFMTVMTPWGQQTLKAAAIRTRVNPSGTNPMPPLPPVPTNLVESSSAATVSTNLIWVPSVGLVPMAPVGPAAPPPPP